MRFQRNLFSIPTQAHCQAGSQYDKCTRKVVGTYIDDGGELKLCDEHFRFIEKFQSTLTQLGKANWERKANK